MTDRPTNPSRPTPAAIKLAERYGITAEAMEEIISGTRAEYTPTQPPADQLPAEQPQTSQPTLVLPPVHAGNTPAIEEAAIVAATSASVIATAQAETSNTTKPEEQPSAADKPRPIAGNPTAPTRTRETIRTQSKTSSAGILTMILTLVVIGIGVALSFQRGCFKQRRDMVMPTPVDTIQNLLSEEARKASTPPFTPTQTAPSQVPPEALAVPREEPPGTSGPSSNSGTNTTAVPSETPKAKSAATHKHKVRTPKPILETSSNLAAQERLAELRADGNTRAKIKAVRKHGTTVYQLQGK